MKKILILIVSIGLVFGLIGVGTQSYFSDVETSRGNTFTAGEWTYTITASAGDGGSINHSGEVIVPEGENKTFTIISDDGYKIADVLVDGVSKGAVDSYTFENVTDNHTIYATFELITYTITATAGDNGEISPAEATVEHGGNKTFTITPADGYEIDAVEVDAESVGVVSSYQFTNVTQNHTIHATFEKIEYTITATSDAGGSIDPSGDVTVNEGDNQTFTIKPDIGYVIDGVLVDGTSVGAVSSYEFTNVTQNHTIYATFKEDTND